MVRLPASHMLDRRIADGTLQTGDVHGLAARLAAFFAGARPARMSPRAYRDRFCNEVRLTCEAFDACGSAQQRSLATRIARRIEAFIARREPLLQERRAHLVDGHGDLRLEHICLGSVARVIDCLEFRADLRLLDPVQELAFLAMECARLGAPATVERIFFGHYTSRTGDAPPPVLVEFYKAIGAFIRARIAILHLRDPQVRDPAKWPKRADEYLAIAVRHGASFDFRRHRISPRA
jgi:aminoglycoside phosphotransferase family enzyme